MAQGRPRQRVGPESLSPDHDDANLSRHADLGARTARGVRRSLAAGAGSRHDSPRARQPHGTGRGSVHRAAPDARPAVAARAGGLPAARRLRFLVQRSGVGTGAERGCVPAACRPRTRARARRATTPRTRAAGRFGRVRREACAAPVRIRRGNAVGRSRCADAAARERRARRDGRRRQGDGGAERDRRRRSRGAVPGRGHAQTPRCVVARRLHAALCDHQRSARCHRGLTRRDRCRRRRSRSTAT